MALRWIGISSYSQGEATGLSTEERRAEKALQDSERRFISFVDSIPTLAWMANADGWITWYNRRWYEYTGTTPQQMEGWGWQDVHDPTVLPSVMERWKSCIETGQPFQMVFPLRGADGVFRSFLTRVSPDRDDAGIITQWFGTSTEVDELQRTREALEANEQELRFTVDLNPQIPWSTDPEGNLIDFSPRWLKLTGFNREEAFRVGWLQVIHPEDRPTTEKAWQHALQTGEPYDAEHRIRASSGEYCWRRTRAFPRRDESGRIVKWYVTTEDIDEQKKAQRALSESEERLRLALASVRGMGTFDWDVVADLVHLDQRLSELFDIEPSEGLAGAPLAKVLRHLHPDDRPPVERVIQHTVDTGEEYATDYRLVQPDGSVRWISARGACIFDSSHTAIRFLGVCLDITERKLTEQALIQNEKLAVMGRLAASIAHEINNPLESVTNLLYLARSSAGSTEVLGYIETAEQELRRVSAISSQTLRFHRQSTKPTLIACDELTESVLSVFQGRLRNSPVRVEKRKRAARPVMCYEGEIRQVMSNLVGNAIDAMARAPGRLLLRSREGVSWTTGAKGIIFTVADTGPGMSPQTVKRAFEPFFTTKDVGGTGLGLWISQEIVSRHNGSLRFKSSQRRGRAGTVFTMFLPFDAAPRS